MLDWYNARRLSARQVDCSPFKCSTTRLHREGVAEWIIAGLPNNFLEPFIAFVIMDHTSYAEKEEREREAEKNKERSYKIETKIERKRK